jgi:uncharacterized protein YbaR (Trm112 family)
MQVTDINFRKINTFDRGMVRILACPSCRNVLKIASDTLKCARCGTSYPIIRGIPDLRRKNG